MKMTSTFAFYNIVISNLHTFTACEQLRKYS